MLARHLMAGFFLAAIGLVSGNASHAEPAVDRVNLRWVSGYEFEFKNDDQSVTRFGPGSFFAAFRPEEETHSFSSRMILTLPIAHRLGGRVRAGGGAQRLDENVDLDVPPLSYHDHPDYWGWNVDVGADFFFRNPDIGYIETGYTYRHEHVNFHPDTDQRSQIGILAAGLYLTDTRIPPVDFDLRFAYERTSLHMRTSGRTWPIYDVEAVTSVYLGERVRLGVGGQFSYEDIDPLHDASIRDARALARLLWLAPIGGRSTSLTIALRSTVGAIKDKSRSGDFERTVASVGIEIGLLYPAGDSLVRLVRERW